MKFKAIKLKSKTGIKLKIGMPKYEIDYIPSDTLYSALINSVAKLDKNKAEEIIEKTLKGKFLLSSAFLGIQINDKEIYFLPRPFIKPEKTDDEEEMKKRLRRVKYVSLKLFEEILNNVKLLDDTLLTSAPFGRVTFGKFGVMEDELPEYGIEIFVFHDEVSVGIDRLQRGSVPFYQTFLYGINYKDVRPFFYFLYLGDETYYFELMAEEGIGAERSSGAGRFEIEEGEIELNIKDGEYCVNLSLVYPSDADLKNCDFISYQIIPRGGWITSIGGTGYLKPRIMMIKEGSVIKNIPHGELYKIDTGKLEHPVYHYGINFGIKFGVK